MVNTSLRTAIICIVFFTLIAISFSISQNPAINQLCNVINVYDGDTFSCLTDNKQKLKVRMIQIDAPEYKQDFGQKSKIQLSELIFGKTVNLKINGKDKYDRTLAEVYLDSRNVNKEMVQQGYAWAYREYLTDQSYIELEATAKSQKLGLWSQENPIYPSTFRNSQKIINK